MKRSYKILVLMLILLVLFFRKPNILLLENDNPLTVRGPCFGKVLETKYNPENNTYSIAIFLSIFDIHWQLNPINGIIKDVKYDNTGKFELAFDLNKSRVNEKAITTYSLKSNDTIEAPSGSDFPKENPNKVRETTFLNREEHILHLYQIAGKFARRIFTYVKPEQEVKKGEIMGLIAFGSRVDLIIENGDKFVCSVNKDDKVKGSKTIIGYWEN